MTETLLKLGGLLGALSLGLGCGADAGSDDGPTVTIRNQVVSIEIARTPAQQVQGLSDRASLDWNRGMLFVYDEANFQSFWMRRMHFDIDIVWIRGGRIVGIEHFVPYPRENPLRPATRTSPELTDRVLEVPAGYAQVHGWQRGDRVTVDLHDSQDP
jgi:uncharacterized membrane protein (UPF0127 family)